MPDTTSRIQFIATARDQASAQIKTLNRNIQGLGTSARSVGGAGFGPLGSMIGGMAKMTAISFGVGAAIGVASQAAEAFEQWLGKGILSALAEQKQLAQLNVVMADNTKGWDGNIDALNRAIEAHERLGFTDDDLRTAFSHLIVQTRDQTVAFRELAIAEDIARARDMSLSDAADLVNKAVLGNSRALRQLGIDATGAKTGLERLTLIQNAFAGSSEAYLTTTEGKLRAANIQVGEISESLGSLALPLIADYSKAFLDLATNLNAATGNMLGFQHGAVDMSAGLYLGQAYAESVASGVGGGGAVSTVASAFGDMFGAASRQARGDVAAVGAQLGAQLTDNLADSLRGNKGFVKSAMHDVLWALNHPHALERQLGRLQSALDSPRLAALLTSANPMQRLIGQQIQGRLTGQVEALTSTTYTKGVTDIVSAINSLKGYLHFPGYTPLKVEGPASAKQFTHYAKGGYIPPGSWGQVGEDGVEYVRAGRQGATVTPSAGHGHPIYLNGRLVGQAIDEYLGRQLSLTPSGVVSRG